MIVLGVDPGTRYTGYGLVEERGNTLRAISCGPACCRRRPFYPMPR